MSSQNQCERDSSSTPYLDKIATPRDFRNFGTGELKKLAAELRQVIIETVAKNGGHLAPGLGVVELTLALHKIFDTPKDKIIWDVGHQSYAHKILTGRRKQFATLRQHKGLSGFPKTKESEYDCFQTGHSSTSISAATGMAIANDLKNGNGKTIAVIHLDKDLIVILNDNEMSISPNVGAMSSFLSRKLAGKTMSRVKNHLTEKLGDFEVGENILNILRKSEESFKSFFTPGMLFEAFKFNYVGPIDGHNIEELLETLEEVRDVSQGPVLVHVLTKKGKGYQPAEENPGKFHGLGPFDKKTGQSPPSSAPASYTKVFGDTLCRMAESDNRITAISAAMTSGTGLVDFSKKYPTHFFDVGIAEQHAVTFAAGLASQGMHPVVAVYSSFFQRAYDQIIHDICIPNLPVTLAIDRAGVVGDDGPTHHGVFDLSYLGCIPNIVIMAPKDENELQHMLYTAVHHKGPAAVRYPRGAGEGVALDETLVKFDIGKAELIRPGNDLLLLPIGNRVAPAVAAAKELERKGLDVAVINPRFAKPLDEELICHWTKKCGNIITIEDGTAIGGFGSTVLTMLSKNGIFNVKSKILGHPDTFVEHGPQKVLWQESGIDVIGIVEAGLELMGITTKD